MSWRFHMLAFCLLAAGCARLVTKEPEKPNPLPAARMSSDAVALQVTFARLPAADTDAYEEIWSAVEEQSFSAELRSELAVNGLRVGVVGQHLPVKLRAAIDEKRSNFEDGSESRLEAGTGSRLLQVRAGRPSQIVASDSYPSLALLLVEDGQLRGHQLTDAQCALTLKPYPLGDGRVKLDIRPEVQHGALRAKWGGHQGSLVLREAREKILFDRLRMEAVIAPGESLILSTTPEIKGLGEYFFSEAANGQMERTTLIVRLAQSQYDDLFAPEKANAPLATPGE